MAHVSDFTKSENQILLDLINESNQTNFTTVELSLGSVRADNGRTVAVLTPAQGTGYGGTVDVTYDRIKIAEMLDLYYPNGMTLALGNAAKVVDFLPEINAGLGTAITAASVMDAPIGEWEGTPNETKDMVFRMAETSLVYEGLAIITITGNDIPLGNVVTQTILRGLNLPGYEDPDAGEPGTRVRVDMPLDGSIEDLSGNLELVSALGYPNDEPIFVEREGRQVLQIQSQALTFRLKEGRRSILDSRKWRIDFEAVLSNPGAFRHESLFLASHDPDFSTSQIQLWKYYQGGNRVYGTGGQYGAGNPFAYDNTPFPADTWRKFSLRFDAETGMLTFYVNDVLSSQGPVSGDFTWEHLCLGWHLPPNVMVGLMRNIKVID